MNRTALIAISVVVLAVVLFGLTLLADGRRDTAPDRRGAGWRERSDPEGGRYASGRQAGSATLRGGKLGPNRGGGGGEASGASGERGTGVNQGTGGAGGTRGEGRRGADVRLSPSGSRSGGAVASSTSKGTESSAMVGAEGGRLPGLRDQADARRGEVVDSLSKQPPLATVDSVFGPEGEAEKDDAVDLPPVENEVLDFPVEASTQDKGGALKFEIQPDWDGTSEDYQSFLRITSGPSGNKLEMYRGENNSLYLVFRDNADNERSLSVPVGDWVAGERHTVGVTWQQGELEFLIDGSSVGQTTYPGTLEFGAQSRIFVGQTATHMHKVESAGVLENFKLYPHSLSGENR
jgi:hypothetical protein